MLREAEADNRPPDVRLLPRWAKSNVLKVRLVRGVVYENGKLYVYACRFYLDSTKRKHTHGVRLGLRGGTR